MDCSPEKGASVFCSILIYRRNGEDYRTGEENRFLKENNGQPPIEMGRIKDL
jgi:hypothetical protein